jgi:hypothetical protein
MVNIVEQSNFCLREYVLESVIRPHHNLLDASYLVRSELCVCTEAQGTRIQSSRSSIATMTAKSETRIHQQRSLRLTSSRNTNTDTEAATY